MKKKPRRVMHYVFSITLIYNPNYVRLRRAPDEVKTILNEQWTAEPIAALKKRVDYELANNSAHVLLSACKIRLLKRLSQAP